MRAAAAPNSAMGSLVRPGGKVTLVALLLTALTWSRLDMATQGRVPVVANHSGVDHAVEGAAAALAVWARMAMATAVNRRGFCPRALRPWFPASTGKASVGAGCGGAVGGGCLGDLVVMTQN